MSKEKSGKRKSNYSNHHKLKKTKLYTIENGMKGFLCTCNFREKECIRDAYQLLEEYLPEGLPEKAVAEGPETKTVEEDEKKSVDDKEVEEEEDVSDTLNRELEELNQEMKNPSMKPLQYLDTGVKNVIFMRCSLDDPLEVVSKILQDIVDNKKQRSRFILRCLPVQLICKASINDIKSKSDDVLGKFYSEAKTFSIIFNRRYNNTIDRTEVIDALAEIIQKKNSKNKADLKNPQLSVVVEIIKNQCFLSIAPDYFKYKKYNLLELSCSLSDSKKASNDQPGEDEREEKLSHSNENN